MSLTNAQYDSLMRLYQERQLQNRILVDERKAQLYATVPALQDIDQKISKASLDAARANISGHPADSEKLHEFISQAKEKKLALITEAGFPKNYLEPDYVCPDCKDTGYIGNERCHCFKQASIDLVYKQSNLTDILERENFDTFKLEYFSNTITDKSGVTSRENAEKACHLCKNFVQNFSATGGNIFLYGTTGTGKTFLSNCIAKGLLDDGHSVIYTTAVQLFSLFDSHQFHNGDFSPEDYANIFTSDLLIIDDLGTEAETRFTGSELFTCLNERILRQKSTIISTNLSIEQFSERYTQRVFSRVSSSYKFIKLYGDDIRIIKKFQK